MPNLVGIGLSQVPTNSMLGGLAYQSPDHASIKDLDLKNLSQINSEIADTATDIFIYDTSKDSDGGAWRKRTTHTSWYNETLNTATRGSRREFPAVAVIVAERNFIKIYDGDDPDLPMWMVFNTIAGGNSQGMANTPMVQLQNVDKVVYALNGILVTGTKNEGSNYGQPVINFISEKVLRMDSQGGEGGKWMGNIAQRNEAIGYQHVDYDYVIVASRVNDIAMTVLPNAPIDSATGLPVPTIAVATDSGTSIIRDDGTVVDMYTYNHGYVAFDDAHNLIVGRGDGPILYAGPIPSADIVETSWRAQSDVTYFGPPTAANIYVYTSTYDPGDVSALTKNAFGYDTTLGRLVKFDLNTNNANSTMVAYATTSYNTGWMHGDIKGAYLSDTDDTNLVYTDLLGGKGTFDDASYWTLDSNWSIGSGVATSNGSNGYISKSGVLTTGARYAITITITSYTSGTLYVYAGTGAPGLLNHYSSASAAGTFTFTLDAYNTNFGLYSSGFSGSVDDVSVSSVVGQDRSVNVENLGVFGTINKSAVATGAELVAYHGFNSSNYLRHKNTVNYGSPATITMGGWSKISASSIDGNYRYLCSVRSGAIPAGIAIHRDTGGSNDGKPYFYDITNSSLQEDNIRVDDNQWHHIIGVLDGTSKKLYIDGKLVASATVSNVNLSAVDMTNVGHYVSSGDDTPSYNHGGYLALIKFSGSAASDEQIKKMYEDEKHLFQENAKCTLYGSSDAVTALAYDEVTEQLHVGTSSGRSDFQGLHRINNTTTAVTTAISAHDGFIVEQ